MLIHAVLIVSEGQTSAEFVKIQMPEINSVVCVTGIFPNASEAGAFIAQFVDAMAYWCHILAGFEWASKARQIQLLPFPLAGAESLVTGQGGSCRAEQRWSVQGQRGWQELLLEELFLNVVQPKPHSQVLCFHRCKLCLCSRSSQGAASARLFLSPSSPNLESVHDLYCSVILQFKNSSPGWHRKQ